MSYYSRIIGTGGYLPEKVITNADLEKLVDTTDDWITERTGIRRRHVMRPDETTASMSFIAAERALAAAGISADELDMILVGTVTPDRVFPSVSCMLQRSFNLKNQCIAFDISAACAGFIYGLSIVDQYIKNGVIKNALVVGAESLTKFVDWTDRGTCILFSDAAGAVVVTRDSKPGILSTHLHADGRYTDMLYAANHYGDRKDEKPVIKMQGSEVFKLAVNALNDIVDETLQKNNLQKSDIDWLIPHQANMRIITATAKKLGLPMERVVLTIEDHANSSAASIPLALDVAVRDGRIKAGELLLMEAFGGGMTWGSALVRW